jgi:Fic family protein
MLRLEQLAGLIARIPDQKRFVKAYVIKEALLTSAIEGIHTTLLDIFTEPLASSEVRKETRLVLNYTRALNTVIEAFEEGLPVSTRLIKRAHEALLRGEGDSADPGNYRKQSVRVGALVPPPTSKINALMGDLEQYVNAPDEALPVLIRAGACPCSI